MKQVFGLLFLLAHNEVECITWRRPSTLVASPTTFSTLTFVRGGSENTLGVGAVSIVPEDTVKDALDSNLQQGVARGGSTATRSHPPRNNSSPQPTPLSSSSSPSVVSSNATVAEVTEPKPKPVSVKHHKRHKHIAKKLKVSYKNSGQNADLLKLNVSVVLTACLLILYLSRIAMLRTFVAKSCTPPLVSFSPA
jgi:hypothetical protein